MAAHPKKPNKPSKLRKSLDTEIKRTKRKRKLSKLSKGRHRENLSGEADNIAKSAKRKFDRLLTTESFTMSNSLN